MSGTIKEQVEKLQAELDKEGEEVSPQEVDHVDLQMDYQIIEHFSEHLYDSPNKAIEELVANGFDAFAKEVHVFTPGPYTVDRVLVWDNGSSMDVEGLKRLWWIAKSPKLDGERIKKRDGITRKIIGKFGIGKLASYSVGGIISHICRHQEQFYLVSIDYSKVHGNDKQPPVSPKNPISAPIYQLREHQALDLLKNLFNTPPPSIDCMLNQNSWTCAVIENLKVEDLPPGRLMWVLGNGMPLRPDFVIKVNEDEVQSKLSKQAVIEWNFGSKEIVNAVKSRWQDTVMRDGFSSSIKFGSQIGLNPNNSTEEIPFIQFPHLGQVWGNVRLFDETLLKYRSADNGRSHGFFLMILGRLMNPDDEQLFLPDPSFQTFYRSQFIIHADDLDDELLADRQRLRRDESVEELEFLQKALAGVARTTIEARDTEREENQSTRSILPVSSRMFYRDPLNALLLRAPIDNVNFDPATADVERKPLGENEPISKVAMEEGAFHVNSLHPYYSVLEKRAGQSKVAREMLRTFDLFAISERLLEGHLLDIGLCEEDIAEIIEWREGLFRRLATSYDNAPKIINEMHRLSYIGGRRFEKSLRSVFEDMGFSAHHSGTSGREDVLVMATVGPESYTFTVEAKGSKNEISNDDAEVSAAANHRDQVNADHAVIIARKFSGFGKDQNKDSAALLKECASTQRVSILQTEALERLHKSIIKFSYPLPLLRDIFTTLETPAKKLATIKNLTTPVEGFDYSALLQQLWQRQGNQAKDDVVAYRSVFQDGDWKNRMDFDDFQRRLVALDTLAAGRISMKLNREHIYLRQSPDLILTQIEKSLHGGGHDFQELETKQ